MAMDDFAVNGFLCPGHVATIIGEEGFRFLPEEYGMPAVIGGFEPDEILLAVYLLLKQIAENSPRVQNAYPRAVRPEGNRMAQKVLWTRGSASGSCPARRNCRAAAAAAM